MHPIFLSTAGVGSVWPAT